MKKNVLIISTSPHKGGNSDILADEFRKGALESGHQVKKLISMTKLLISAKAV